MKVSAEEQLKIIAKGTDSIVSRAELMDKLIKSEQEQRPLVIKLGLDPSAPDIHLGHAVVLRKIKQMQDLGHRAVIVIGDFTGKIGDPTGKAKGRKPLTDEQVRANAKTYEKQIFKILDRNKTDVRFNSEWLGELKMEEVIRLASSTTVARMMERDDFQKRYTSNIPIGVHEFFYPLMQAYDSVVLESDIELGGTDQTFNILMGRNLMRSFGLKEQTALFMPILEGLDGVEKMSKSLGNYIGINEEPEVMFKKVMEVPDHLIVKYYELATDEHPDRIEEIKRDLEEGRNPRDLKYEMAAVITGLYHGEDKMDRARQYYDTAFAGKGIPDDIPELVIPWEKDTIRSIIPLLAGDGWISSNGEFRRLLTQGGVKVNGEKTDDMDQVLACGDVIQIGKKKFLRIIK